MDGALSKPRRPRRQTKGLMNRTIAVHVRYQSLYISLPSSAKRQREIPRFCVVYGTWTTTANSFFHLELNAIVAYLASARFLRTLAYQTDLDNREFSLQNINSFFIKRLPRRRRRSLSSLMTSIQLIYKTKHTPLEI